MAACGGSEIKDACRITIRELSTESSPKTPGDAWIPDQKHRGSNSVSDFSVHTKNDIQFDWLSSASTASLPKRPSCSWLRSCGAFFRRLFTTWRWELFTWLVGTLGFIAMIALLAYFNGKPQSHWNSRLQITAIIAALAQLSQSSLIVATAASIGQAKWAWLRSEREAIDIDRFDLASRGPDGALRLLWDLKFRPYLASIGALCTILLLAFPTFVQQALTVVTRETGPLRSIAYLHRAGSPEYTLDTVESYDPNFPESIDVVNGIVGGQIDPTYVYGKCEQGASRCTWGPYTMLSICSSVEDITSSLVQNVDPTLPPTIPYPGLGLDFNERTTVHSKVHLPIRKEKDILNSTSLPANRTAINTPRIADIYIAMYQPCLDPSQDRGGGKAWGQERLAFKDITTSQHWTLFKATFQPCLQTFESIYDDSWNTGIKSTILGTANNTQWRHIQMSDGTIKYCARGDYDENEYCLGHNLAYDMGASIYTAFNFQVERLNEETEVIASPTNTSRWAKILLRDLRVDPRYTTSPLVCDLLTSGFNYLKYRVSNIAASLSATMRYNRHGEMLSGKKWITELVVKVSMTWLLMPILLWITMTALFFTTVACGKDAPPWKSSALAMLKCTDPRNEMTETREFRRYARRTFVRLEHNGMNWQLLQSRRRTVRQGQELEGK